MTHYLIEFRFFGKAKHNIKKLIYEVDRRFRLHGTKRHRPIPHITIVAPFSTKNQRKLVQDFKSTCSDYSIMNFKIEGYGCFDNTKVVYVNIEPSEELKRFRKGLIRKLEKYCKLKSNDVHYFLNIFKSYREWSAHATIAKRISPSKFEKVRTYVDRKDKPNFEHYMIRATLIKNSKILCEYDFVLRKLLSRREAKSKQILAKTIKNLEGVCST